MVLFLFVELVLLVRQMRTTLYNHTNSVMASNAFYKSIIKPCLVFLCNAQFWSSTYYHKQNIKPDALPSSCARLCNRSISVSNLPRAHDWLLFELMNSRILHSRLVSEQYSFVNASESDSQVFPCWISLGNIDNPGFNEYWKVLDGTPCAD